MSEQAAIDPRALRDAFGCFPTGVTIITTISRNGEAIGTTMNSFSSVSLDPPLVLFALDRSSDQIDDFMTADCFAINILCDAQTDLSNRFATSGRDPLTEAEFDTWLTGSPILKGALTSLDCRIKERYDGGDHVIFLCEIVQLGAISDAAPHVYFRGKYASVQTDAS